MNTICRRWAAAGVAWVYRDADARVGNAVPPGAAGAAVHSVTPVGFAASRAWRGGGNFLDVVGTLAVVAMISLRSRFTAGLAAPRPTIPFVELERARLAA